jgi:hypothetical protein
LHSALRRERLLQLPDDPAAARRSSFSLETLMEWQPVVILLWIASAIAGGIAAASRGAAMGGTFLGLFFGPLGVIAALGLDNRAGCPRCAGRLDGRGLVCQHCGVSLAWPHPCCPKIADPSPASKSPPPPPDRPWRDL